MLPRRLSTFRPISPVTKLVSMVAALRGTKFGSAHYWLYAAPIKC